MALVLVIVSHLGGGLARAQDAEAAKGISDLYAALDDVMHMGRTTPFPQRFDVVAPVIDRVFDLESILQASVGLRWTSLDETSRQMLFTVFRIFTIATYVANFDEAGGDRFEVLAKLRPAGEDQIVQTKLTASNGEPIRIDYVMRAGPLGWRAVDVLLNGSISRVAVQRSDFRSLLAYGGPNGLADSLKKKIVDLSGGALRP
jgi:phospholipid transport system substrate-binding protein